MSTKMKSIEVKKEHRKTNEEAAALLISELQKVQKEENDSLEKKDVLKREIIECESILKKYDDKRIQLKEQLKYLEKKTHDFVKRRNEIIARFKESHRNEGDCAESQEMVKQSVHSRSKDDSETEASSFIQTESSLSKIDKDIGKAVKREPTTANEVNEENKTVNKRKFGYQDNQQKRLKDNNTYPGNCFLQQSNNFRPKIELNSSNLQTKENLAFWDSYLINSSSQPISNSITADHTSSPCTITYQLTPSSPSKSQEACDLFHQSHLINDTINNSSVINSGSSNSSCSNIMSNNNNDHNNNNSNSNNKVRNIINNNNNNNNNNINIINNMSNNCDLQSPPQPIYKLNKLTVTESNHPNNRSICFLRAIDQHIYVSCKDGTVKRYNIENHLDFISYRGNVLDAVITILVDYKHSLLFTGSKLGVFRCFKLNTGYLMGTKTLFSQIQTICQGWNRIVVALSDGKIIQLEFKPERLSETNEKFKLKDRILSICPLANKKIFALLVNSRPQIVDATNGTVIKTFSTDFAYFPAYIEIDHFFCFTATSCASLPLDNKKSTIVVYDQASNWQVVIRKQERGVITAMQNHMKRLYVAILFYGFTRFHCYSTPDLGPIWIAYSNRERVFGLTLYGSYLIIGSEVGEITCLEAEKEGPYFCRNRKCNCLIPFARKSDLETHHSMIHCMISMSNELCSKKKTKHSISSQCH